MGAAIAWRSSFPTLVVRRPDLRVRRRTLVHAGSVFLTGGLGIIDEDGDAAVDDVCVIGVPHDKVGELVCACIATSKAP
jgi:acyl-CoA synthetase (AMP-forming)/AMP-acid ligase II